MSLCFDHELHAFSLPQREYWLQETLIVPLTLYWKQTLTYKFLVYYQKKVIFSASLQFSVMNFHN